MKPRMSVYLLGLVIAVLSDVDLISQTPPGKVVTHRFSQDVRDPGIGPDRHLGGARIEDCRYSATGRLARQFAARQVTVTAVRVAARANV